MAEVPDEAFSFAPVRPAPEALAQIPAFEAPGASADDVAAEDDMAFEAALRELERQSTPAAREERKAELTATAPILAIDISGDTPAAAADIRPAEAVRREVPAPHAQAGRHSQPAAASRSPEPPLPEAAPVPRQPMAATRRSVRLLEETAWTVAPANDAGPVAVQNEQLVQKIAEDLIIALAERERARDEDARFGAAAEGDGGAAHEPPVSLEDLPFKLEIPDIVRQALARHTEAAPERHSALAAQRNLAPMPLELGRRERIRQELERQQAERRLKRERMEAEQSAYDRDHDGAGHAPQARPASPMPMRRVADRSGTSGPNRA
ncbi:hypothetical protein [Ancylobacter lacus]|uniref:hypothetical protein n=1 Tax=Ancylobacter lacus TaxID=2579970 RepID=UPI001BCBF4FD|nr:hypothetical protein [Ancylobacter lacus]MBS7540808.1 hypothetical protein [Ancylobacter lacus]